MKPGFSLQFSRNTEILNFVKFVQWEQSPLMRAKLKGRHDKASSRFSQFCDCAYNCTVIWAVRYTTVGRVAYWV
jgi:uncharacterized protein YqiB (DUF1249 family)